MKKKQKKIVQGQELLFGSRSWDYSEVPFNLNGRSCLLYSFFWGFLGALVGEGERSGALQCSGEISG